MKRAYTLLLLLLVLIYCNPKEQEALEPLDSNIRFILFPETDSIYLATVSAGDLEINRSSHQPANATFYLSEDAGLLFSMERTDGEINIMPLDRFGRWLPKPIERPQPTHWTGAGNHSLIFNDGDGSVIYVKADQSTTEGFTLGILEMKESVAHHGAALYLNNDAVAMTVKSEDEEGALPKKVALVDIKSQETLMTTDERPVGGIHGAHSNGIYALFGSTDGILWVKNDQSFGLIPYPQPLENSSGNWLGTIKGAGDSFIGISRNHGLFKIDPEKLEILSLYDSDQIADFKLSKDGKYTVVLTKENHLVVLENVNLRVIKESPVPNQPETIKGFKFEIIDDKIFLAALGYLELQVLDVETLQSLHRINSSHAFSDFKVILSK